ncbi:hypothetical protein N7530_005304 [Penicillium desertorum]|uniref:Uncharacterized protein n=1 Tax=Penicillium desertorum TaxID=1303715 RepID=A0A9X0BR78_9EURO|nr:hypothetical protein N7530_005304 [Penicillium desertorum]
MTSTPNDAEHLLSQYEKDDLPYSQSTTSRWKQAVPWILAGIFGLIGSLAWLRHRITSVASQISSEKVVNKCQIASARKLIEFEKRQMKASDDHLYVGTPSQEVDDAWIRLIHGLVHFGKGPLMTLIKPL